MKTIKDREYSFQHTKARLQERYQLSLYRDEYDVLCQNTKCINGVIEQNGDDVQKIVKARFKGKIVTFVYSLNRDCVTTVLP